MPFRFRKSLKIGKGLRLNLSKTGVSASLGGRGHSLNVGPRGVHQTIGIPGSGLSYRSKIASPGAAAKSLAAIAAPSAPPVQAPVKTKLPPAAWWKIVLGVLSGGTLGFCALVFIVGLINPKLLVLPTKTPTPTAKPTNTPGVTVEYIPGPGLVATFTFTLRPDQITPTLTPAPACDCSADLYNCADFASSLSAQRCFDYCISQGAGDVHQLDGNNDGRVCQ
jgi:hypothetical protein